MALIPLADGVNFAIVDDEDLALLSRYSWSLSQRYAVAYVEGRTRRMHQLLMKCPDGILPDHRNRNRLDNRRSNLRFATRRQNVANSGISKTNKSGYKGVTWNKQAGRWKAQIRAMEKRLFLGYYADVTEAAKAYDAKAKEIFGEFAFLNFDDRTVSPSTDESRGFA